MSPDILKFPAFLCFLNLTLIKFPAFLCFMNTTKIPGFSCLINIRALKIPAFFVLHGGTNPPEFPAFLCFENLPRPKIQHFVLHEPQIFQMSSIYVLRRPHISNIVFFREPQCCGCVKMEPFVFLTFFLCVEGIFYQI